MASDPSRAPCVLFFNINGSGMGHMTTCLAYAHRLREHARCVFFSLASAIEMIHDFGFEADYFVSPFWSRAKSRVWNYQLVQRFGLLLERVQPDVIVFDGTWPFQGMLNAVEAYGEVFRRPRLVWSNLMLYKPGTPEVPVSENLFDLVIHIGELGTAYRVERGDAPGRKVAVPPVTLLRDQELVSREEARAALGLAPDGRYALFSLGPGNLKDVSDIGRGLIGEMRRHGITVVWAQAPISVRDVPVPDDVVPIRRYPLVRFMRAFDYFAGAAGYNTCCEVIQSGVPTLFVPNTQVIDDQIGRAELIAQHLPAVVSACETPEQRADAVTRLLEVAGRAGAPSPALDLQGAEYAADEILALVGHGSEAHSTHAVQGGAA
jgi:hypothetical protein